jgi:hypothetical protein
MRRELAVFTFFAALAVALTWPLVASLSTAISDPGDPLLNAWIVDWSAHALTHDPLHLFDAPIFYPAKFPLAFSEHMTGVALLILPFHLAGAGAVTVHNLALLISFALSGYGAYVLARLFTHQTSASLVAGILYAFVPFKFDHLSHVQIIACGWIPLTLAALIAYWRSGRRIHATAFAAAFVMNGLSNVYWLLFTAFAVAMTVGFLAVIEPRNKQFWRRLAVVTIIAALVLIPFLVPYAVVSRTYRMQRNSFESSESSAVPSDWLHASGASLLYGGLDGKRAERNLFPGSVMLLLAAAGLMSGRREPAATGPSQPVRRWSLVVAGVFATIALVISLMGRVQLGTRSFSGADVPLTIAVAFAIAAFPMRTIVARSRFRIEIWIAVIWIVIGFIASLGEHAFLHAFLFRVVMPFRATRAPARWAIIAYAGLAILAAEGVKEARNRWGRKAIAVALIAALIDVLPRLTWQHVPSQSKPVYSWLATTKPAAVLELPVGWNSNEAYYVLANSVHRVPILNGISGFDPPFHEMLSKHAYDTDMLRLVRNVGCTVVIVHPAAAQHAQSWIDSGQLRLLARFSDGDAAYAIEASRL